MDGMVMRMVEPPRSGSAIDGAVEAVGDRWPLLVPRDVACGDRRYSRVRQDRSDRARRLAVDGLLTRAQAGRGRCARHGVT
jgi:hypothetical protein